MKIKTKQLGEHYLIELIDCNPEKIKFIDGVKDIFLNAAKKSKATIINHFFHQFEPCGVSGVILIAESHISLHTWPEDNYAAVDIFTCGDEMDVKKGIDALIEGFEVKNIESVTIKRGF